MLATLGLKLLDQCLPRLAKLSNADHIESASGTREGDTEVDGTKRSSFLKTLGRKRVHEVLADEPKFAFSEMERHRRSSGLACR
ncbi:hypothetical protein ASE31_10635 [Acidovorax sp. Root217]|nr:hypothetical protein ASE31_10635 [Acidovorax sp. Root217]